MTDDLLQHFVMEAREQLQAAAADLLALEEAHPEAPPDASRIDSAFRAVHTLKGSVGLFDLGPLGGLLHAGEDVLGAFRDRRLRPQTAALNALLGCVGAIEGWLDFIALHGRLPPGAEAECRRLTDQVQAQSSRAEAVPGAPGPPGEVGPPGKTEPWLAPLLAREAAALAAAAAIGKNLVAVRYVPDRDCFFRGDDPLALLRGIDDLQAVQVSLQEPVPANTLHDPFACNLVIECLSGAPMESVRRALRLVGDQAAILPVPSEPAPPSEAAAPGEPPGLAARMLRIDAQRLDALADLAGELVIAKNRLAHVAAAEASLPPSLVRSMIASQAEIHRLATEIERRVTRLRLVRLEQSFRRLPLLVRETAARLGKRVRLECLGEETEADKSVADALPDPLLHIIRNAIDHGIEDAPSRDAAGKPAEALVRVVARRDGNQILVTVQDDGRGIDPAQVRQRALSKGLITAGQCAALDDAASLDLIFAAGFSTADRITDLSGRGVGLDAVRRFMGAIGGRVSVRSRLGRGTWMLLTAPLSAALTTVMTVAAGTEIYGIPFDYIVETTRFPRAGIRPVGDGFGCVLRGRTLPILSLAALLGGTAPSRQVGLPFDDQAGELKLLVVAVGDEHVGISVDGFADRMDVVLRPLGGLLSGLRGTLGTALLGDGRVLIVLNVAELIRHGGGG